MLEIDTIQDQIENLKQWETEILNKRSDRLKKLDEFTAKGFKQTSDAELEQKKVKQDEDKDLKYIKKKITMLKNEITNLEREEEPTPSQSTGTPPPSRKSKLWEMWMRMSGMRGKKGKKGK